MFSFARIILAIRNPPCTAVPGVEVMRILPPIVIALSVFACSQEPQTGMQAAFKACSKGVPVNLDSDQRALLMERCMLSRGYTIVVRAQ